MRPTVKIALLFVFLIALGSIFAALYLYNMEHRDLQNVNPDFVTNAADLAKEFEDDEMGATAKYVNMILEISGTIESVSSGEGGSTTVTLRTGNVAAGVICSFPQAVDTSQLKKDDQITVRGECSGFLMDVLLNKCVIVQKPE
jgi:hypothetical protein